MDLSVIIAIGVAICLLIFVLSNITHTIIKRCKQKNDPNSYMAVPKNTLCQDNVCVINKECGIVQTGSYKYPSHIKSYIISFLLKNGNVKSVDVGEDNFDSIQIGENGLLITENDLFLGFDKEQIGSNL